jgi:hypothetical protein
MQAALNVHVSQRAEEDERANVALATALTTAVMGSLLAEREGQHTQRLEQVASQHTGKNS